MHLGWAEHRPDSVIIDVIRIRQSGFEGCSDRLPSRVESAMMLSFGDSKHRRWRKDNRFAFHRSDFQMQSQTGWKKSLLPKLSKFPDSTTTNSRYRDEQSLNLLPLLGQTCSDDVPLRYWEQVASVTQGNGVRADHTVGLPHFNHQNQEHKITIG